MTQARVLIVDDHPLMRRGLRAVVGAAPDFEICAEAEDLAPALELCRTAEPAVALVDVSLPSGSGLELTKQMLTLRPELRILMVSIHDDEIFAERAIKAGAFGYINKSRPAEELLAALRKVSRGKIALSDHTAERLLRRGVRPGAAPADRIETLSDRELEVFEMIGRGLSTREIAERLCLSVKTVETHRHRIKTKLELDTGTELARHATLWCQATS